MKQIEHTEQVALMQWWALACRAYGVPESMLFAIPNGGRRDPVTGARLKAEGVRAGIPDLFLAVPMGGHGGLFIEMKKSHGGRVSEAQTVCIGQLERMGYRVAVCHGWERAREQIENFLKGDFQE